MSDHQTIRDSPTVTICKRECTLFEHPFHHCMTNSLLSHLDKYHTVVWCQKCHEVFIDDSEDNGDNDAVDRKIAHQKACNAPALPPVDDIIDCDMQAKLHKKLKNYKTPAWELENEDDDMKKWVSTYIGPFTGITKPTADLSVVELKNLRKGRRELAKWYIYWRTLFLRLPHPNPCESPSIRCACPYILVSVRSQYLVASKQAETCRSLRIRCRFYSGMPPPPFERRRNKSIFPRMPRYLI
jgi:hypothetical protein